MYKSSAICITWINSSTQRWKCCSMWTIISQVSQFASILETCNLTNDVTYSWWFLNQRCFFGFLYGTFTLLLELFALYTRFLFIVWKVCSDIFASKYIYDCLTSLTIATMASDLYLCWTIPVKLIIRMLFQRDIIIQEHISRQLVEIASFGIWGNMSVLIHVYFWILPIYQMITNRFW